MADAISSSPSAGACADNVTLHGNPGTVIAQASIDMLFWGGYWTTSGVTDRAQYDAAWSKLANDPAFYARLAVYSTPSQRIGTGSWAGSTAANTSLASGAQITEAQIQQEIAAEVATGTALAQTPGRIYVVLLPPGVTSAFDSAEDFVGHHSQFTTAGDSNPIRYAVITYNSDAAYNDPVISHEISEAITDPDLSSGWYDQSGNEVSDICRFHYEALDGYEIEEIYSIASCSCVAASAPDAGVAPVTANACTAPVWTASGVYTGGAVVSYGGNQYTASYWNQNDEPDVHNGAPGSGQPWSPPTACSAPTCTPGCGGKQCGTDGCGGSCGICAAGLTCNGSAQCVPFACLPSCNLKQCGSDGCGGSCGTCAAALTCNAGNQCVAPCVPACSGKQCGGDTCGGSCGTCAAGETCSGDGTCSRAPTSKCGGLTPWNPDQPWYGYTVGEEHIGSDSHLYTCKNVAYCIDDPTGPVGRTYGWTDGGHC